ncbi:ATP-binding protein [bacterium]|nr:ATP-binding protein [bacterium]
MFVGREQELQLLNKCYKEKKAHFTVVYGRRRIGKTALIEKYCAGKRVFNYTALKTSKAKQIKNFLLDFSKFVSDPLIASAPFHSWREVFELVLKHLPEGKTIFVLDEFQWMCKSDLSLLSVIQLIWDKHWQKNNKIHLILCGSSTSFMLDEVLSHKSPLFGRRTQTIELGPIIPAEAKKILKLKNNYEVTLYLMCLGAIPGYLLLIDKNLSFEQNINRLAFYKNGYFIDELKYILSDQLKQPATYYKILQYLCLKSHSHKDLSKFTGISSGSMSYYLDRLKALRIIEEYRPILLSDTAKTVQFKIVDEYIRFYFNFIKPNLQVIVKNKNKYIFDRITSKKWNAFCGVAFERFCFRNIESIIDKLNIGSLYTKYGPYWHKQSVRLGAGLQIDMVIERRDRTSIIIECKWSKEKIEYGVFTELSDKCSRYPNTKKHKLKKVVIASCGVTKNLIDHPELDVITLDDFY